MILGIVGSAGVGKTTAAQFFEKHGAYIISADKIVNHLYTQENIIHKVISVFESKVTNETGKLDKQKLRSYVFQNYQELQKLEAIIWPKLKTIIIKEITQHKDTALVVVDCAVLFNIGLNIFMDKILVITADEKMSLERIKLRDQISSDMQIFNLLNLQKRYLQLPELADFIIDNNRSIKNFLKRLTKLFFQEINVKY